MEKIGVLMEYVLSMRIRFYLIGMVATMTTISFFSCTKKSSKEERNNLFDWVDKIENFNTLKHTRKNPYITQLDENDLNETINLSNLISDYKFVKLDEVSSALIGDIDKIIFNDSLIYIIDRYVNNSLQIYNISGEFIHAFKPTGQGPKELQSIDDFDVDEHGIYIYDNTSAKFHQYAYDFTLVEEWKIPLRASTFRKIGEKKWLFSIISDPNNHLYGFEKSDLILWDQSTNEMYGFESPFFDHNSSDFTPRDILRNNNGMISAMLRYHPEIYQWNQENQSLETMITFDLGPLSLTKQDFQKIGPDFIKDRENDKKYYTFGRHMITENWIGVEMDRRKAKPLFIFHNRISGQTFSGSNINFDIPGLISFSLPQACKDNTCISHTKFPLIKKGELDAYLEILKEKKLYTTELDLLLRSIDDYETPILTLFKFKNP